jgi:hypothetical protein
MKFDAMISECRKAYAAFQQLARFIHRVFETAVPRRVESAVLGGVGNAAVGV